MTRFVLVALLAAAIAAPASASSQLRRLVEQQLPSWGYSEVDVGDLTTGQVAQLHHIMSSDRSHSDKAALIKSVLNGAYTLPRLPSAL